MPDAVPPPPPSCVGTFTWRADSKRVASLEPGPFADGRGDFGGLEKVKCSRIGLRRPAVAGPVEERRFNSRSLARNNRLKPRHESRLAVMIPANFGNKRLPLAVEPSLLVTPPGLFQVRQSLKVVFALAGVDDAHAQCAEDSRRHAGMRLCKTLRRRLGRVLA